MDVDIQRRLASCFSTIFPEMSPKEIARASTASVAKWDSLATLNLIALIEEEFQIEVQPENLDGVLSFEIILDYVETRQHAN